MRVTAVVEFLACQLGSADTLTKSKNQFVENLYDAQAAPLLKYLTARFHSPDEAVEVAQEAWLRIYRLKNPETLRNAKAFLFQTASNLAIDRLHRSQLENRYHEREATLPPETIPSLERSALAEESLEIITAALEELPDKCRRAFLLHRTRGLSYPEIAEQLDVSTSMVEKYIIQALRLFRQKLDQ